MSSREEETDQADALLMSDRSERWQEIKRVLDVVLEQKPSARARFLERVCAHDRSLLEEVRSLLESEDEGYLERPAMDVHRGDSMSMPEDRPPARVRSYRLVETIGYGGMAVVYRVVDASGRYFALKRLRSRGVSVDALRRFRREAKTASTLHHPNIVRIESFGEQDGDPFLIMEHLSGETLRQLLDRERRTSYDLAVHVARQVGEGLSYAHASGTVHRDLKPSNLFLTEDGVVKILDFGIAKLLVMGERGAQSSVSRLTKTGEVLGTPDYMAPEQARAEPVDARADLFSLGSILYEMLAGRTALSGESLAARIDSLLTEAPEPLDEIRSGLPPTLVQLVHSCLAKTPSERPPSAEAFLSELENTM